jgi:DNA-binding LacI/PurR family transcriptional regulator
MSSRPTAAAVAKTAGVSKTVVSLVVNGKADRYGIATATQDRVRKAIARMDYTPNHAIRNMFLNHQPGIDLDAIRRMETDKLLATLQPILAEKGYRLELETS